MTTSRIWRLSLLAAALPWLAVPACGGRTGDYDLSDGLPSSSGGAGNQSPGGAGASLLGTANNPGIAPGRTNNPVGVSTPPSTGVIGSGGRVGNSPGGGILVPPPIGSGGFVSSPGIGAAGFFGSAGTSFGGFGGGPMQCSVPGSAIAEVCVPPSLPITTCCTSQGRCGLQLFPADMVATNIPLVGGCQPMNQPGYDFAGCPNLGALLGQPEASVSLSPCCRYDGTCGLDLGLVGAGCVQSVKAGKPIQCGPVDAGIDASPVDAGRD